MTNPRGEYPKSEYGNFEIIDSIGVPHPYCITAAHVVYASDHHNGMLDKTAMEGAESNGVRCGMRGCQLTFKEHETALLVACYLGIKDKDDKVNPELHAFLLACKDEAEKHGYTGFTFLDRRNEHDDTIH